MENILSICLIILWGIVLLNLLLTLRVVRWLQSAEEQREQVVAQESLSELSIGMPAPDFSAKTLDNKLVTLSMYAGREVVFIFVSPHCGSCRRKVPGLVALGILAKERSNVEFVLVSDSNGAETYAWLNTIREEDGVEVTLPLLIALHTASDFLQIYNPRSLTPYYCLIDTQGIVQSRDPLGMSEWLKLQREWEGTTTGRLPSRRYV